MFKNIILISLSFLFISCEAVYYEEAEIIYDEPYTYEVCETVLVTEYETVERECADIVSTESHYHCVDLIDEFMYTYPQVECVIGDDFGGHYRGLEINLHYLEDFRARHVID